MSQSLEDATPGELQSLFNAGATFRRLMLLFDTSYNVVSATCLALRKAGFITFDEEKVKGIYVRPVFRAAPVSVLELKKGMCATVVDGEFDLPHYCGQPVTHNYRLCAQCARAFLVPKGQGSFHYAVARATRAYKKGEIA